MLQARFGMPLTQPTGIPAPCPCGFCTVALQQLRDGTWGTGRGDWADPWAVLSPAVAHHTLAHAPTDHSVRHARYWLHNRDCRSCGEDTGLEQVAVGVCRCENHYCPRYALCGCTSCQQYESRCPHSPHGIRVCSTPNRARVAAAFYEND